MFRNITTPAAEGTYSSLAIALDVAMACRTTLNGDSDSCPCGCLSYTYHMLHGEAYTPVAVANVAMVTPSTTAKTVR